MCILVTYHEPEHLHLFKGSWNVSSKIKFLVLKYARTGGSVTDWPIFDSFGQQIFLQNYPKYLVTFRTI